MLSLTFGSSNAGCLGWTEFCLLSKEQKQRPKTRGRRRGKDSEVCVCVCVFPSPVLILSGWVVQNQLLFDLSSCMDIADDMCNQWLGCLCFSSYSFKILLSIFALWVSNYDPSWMSAACPSPLYPALTWGTWSLFLYRDWLPRHLCPTLVPEYNRPMASIKPLPHPLIAEYFCSTYDLVWEIFALVLSGVVAHTHTRMIYFNTFSIIVLYFSIWFIGWLDESNVASTVLAGYTILYHFENPLTVF